MHVRTSIALAAAALLAAPLCASAQARRDARRPPPATGATGASGLSVGGFVGAEAGDLTGFSLRLDGEMPLQALSPQIALSLVGSIGYTNFGKDVPFGDVSFNVFKLVPAARFTLPLNPQLDLYGDAGLGLYYFSSTLKQTVPVFGRLPDATDSGIGLMMRFALGGFFKVNPKLRLGAELGVLPYFNDVDSTDFSILVGAMFAL